MIINLLLELNVTTLNINPKTISIKKEERIIQTTSGKIRYSLGFTDSQGKCYGNDQFNKKLERMAERVAKCVEKMKFPQFQAIDFYVNYGGPTPSADNNSLCVNPLFLLEREDLPDELIVKESDPILLDSEKRKMWINRCASYVQKLFGIYTICENEVCNAYWILQYNNPEMERKAKDFIICHELGHIQQHMENGNKLTLTQWVDKESNPEAYEREAKASREKELDADKKAAIALSDVSGALYSLSILNHILELFPNEPDDAHPLPKNRIEKLESLKI